MDIKPNKFTKKISFKLLLLMVGLLIINSGYIFGLNNFINEISILTEALSQQTTLDTIRYIFGITITVSAIFIAALSIIFGVKTVPFNLISKYYLSTNKVTLFLAFTIFLLLVPPLFIFGVFGEKVIIVNEVYFQISFYTYIILTILFVKELVDINNPTSVLNYILSPSQLSELKKVNIQTAELNFADLNVTTNRFEVTTQNLDYSVNLSTEKEGLVNNIDFETLQRRLEESQIEIGNLTILLLIEPGTYIPNIFSAHYSTDFDRTAILVFYTDREETFNVIHNYVNENEEELIENIIVFQEESELINTVNQQIDDVVQLIKSNRDLDHLNINWLAPLENFIQAKRDRREEITEVETIVIYRFLNKLSSEIEVNFSDNILDNIITFLYRTASLCRQNESMRLGKIILDTLDTIALVLLSKHKEAVRSKIYGIILRFKELSIPINIYHDGSVINSEYLRNICLDALERSVNLIIRVIEYRGYYGDHFVRKFLDYNLQDLISFLSNLRPLQPPGWGSEISYHLAKRLIQIATFMLKTDEENILYREKNESLLFTKYGFDLIKFSYNSEFEFRNTCEVINTISADHRFSHPVHPHISRLFATTLHESGTYTPSYYDERKVWLSFLIQANDLDFDQFNNEFKDLILDKIQQLTTKEIIVLSKVLSIEEEAFREKLNHIREILSD